MTVTCTTNSQASFLSYFLMDILHFLNITRNTARNEIRKTINTKIGSRWRSGCMHHIHSRK